MEMMLGIQIFLGIIGALTLITGGVGVANIMYAVVKERTREIGVKMALGARASWVTGPVVLEGLVYTLLGGALALAVLNFATLATAGHPWSITWAFTLWGAKVARAIGWDPASEPFWNSGFQRDALEASVFADTTSVMDFGILAGAFLAAALAGRFVFRLRQAPGALAAAVLGGLAMGYGARIAYGCNIGAFFSGVASTSLHGWLWIAAALPGCWVGVKLRPWFGVGRAQSRDTRNVTP